MLSNATVVVTQVTATEDDLGNSTSVESPVTLEWALVYPRSSQERTDPRAAAVLSAAQLLAPPGTAIGANDYIVVSDCGPNLDGTWQAEGVAGDWSLHGFGGVEVALKRASGV